MVLFVSCYTSQWPWIRSQPVKNSKASIVINSCMNYIDNLWMLLFVSCYPSQWPCIRSQQVIILNYHSPLLTNNIIIRETTFLLGPLWCLCGMFIIYPCSSPPVCPQGIVAMNCLLRLTDGDQVSEEWIFCVCVEDGSTNLSSLSQTPRYSRPLVTHGRIVVVISTPHCELIL